MNENVRPEYQKYQLIDDYLNNKLSDKERMEFEQVLNEDPEFKEEVYDQKLANEIIIENRFFEVVNSIELSPVAAKPGITSGLKTILGTTLSAGVVITAAFYFLNSKEESPKEDTPVAVQTIPKEIPVQEEIKEVTVPVPSVVDEGKEEESKKTKKIIDKPVKIDKSKKVLSAEESGTYFLEIPLENTGETSFTFCPDKGESWLIPLKNRKKAELKVLDKTGKEVFRIKVSQGKPKTWNGLKNDQSRLEPGDYVYLLDFGNGQVEHGYLTII